MDITICWDDPHENLISENTVFLSFLSPTQEANWVERLERCGYLDRFISGRKIAQDVKDDALCLYTQIIARIGAEKVYNGLSLREHLKKNNSYSLWWYHPVSFKDCESDPSFNTIIQILAIDRLISNSNFERIFLWGASDTIVKVLKSKYNIFCKNTKRKSSFLLYLRAIGSRIIRFLQELYRLYLIKRTANEISFVPDFVFQGFWDWSVRPDKDNNGLEDRYFKLLPKLAEKRGFKIAWFIWFDPYNEPNMKNRPLKDVLDSALSFNNLIFIQRYLNFKDVIIAYLNFFPLIKYITIKKTKSFKNLFNYKNLNLLPIFQNQFIYYFISNVLPHFNLIEEACERSFRKLKPKCAITFLELFPQSRAFYAGARKGNPATVLFTMQHASYSREKTFVRLDPEIEFNGGQDNCAIPKPDYVFVMAELGREIFRECGFAPQNIFVTGSARYDHIKSDRLPKSQKTSKDTINLLVVTSLDRNIEIDLVEAVFLAAKDLPQIKLYLRSHPFAPMEEHPLFKPMRHRFTISKASLEEDLQNADLIIFSYSTVAEEAFVRGIPIWQWRSAGYNGSAFRDIGVIPYFSTVAELKDNLIKFINNPELYMPDESKRREVLKKCFGFDDGNNANRIVEILSSIITSRQLKF